ncbi:MAG: peptide deformylase [Planctomycetota bacterium]|nr:MAG: peptide deformylase [Planctomycetota bacterium]
MPEALQFDLALYPQPVLRKVAGPVEAFDDELARIVEGMLARMRESNGVGLAAPQVGLKQRILVLNPTGEPEDDITLINPTLVEKNGPRVKLEEGCLSFPEIYAEIERPERCKVEAFDIQGNPISGGYEGFVSRIIQHEYDHLEGVLLVDRMSPADKLKNKLALEDLIEAYKAAKGR